MKIDKIISGKLRNNTYIVSNEFNECIIIDASCELKEIVSRTKEYRVLGVLLTHGHYDHFVSLDEIVNYFNVPCFMSKLDFEKLFSPKQNYSIVFNKIYSSKLKENNFTLLNDEKSEFDIGNFKIKSFLTPGHTSGGTCFFVNDEILFTGDTLFKSTCGRTDLITSSSSEMDKSLKFLKDNFKGIKFYPGHGGDGEI